MINSFIENEVLLKDIGDKINSYIEACHEDIENNEGIDQSLRRTLSSTLKLRRTRKDI